MMPGIRKHVVSMNNRITSLFGRCLRSCKPQRMKEMEQDKELSMVYDKNEEPSCTNQSKEVDLMILTSNHSEAFESAKQFQNMKPPDEVIQWTWDTSITEELPDDFFQT